jgi:hypothetical protein
VSKRWQDIGDVRIAMEEDLAPPVAVAAPSRVPWIVAGAACLAALAAVVPLLRPSKTAAKPLIVMPTTLAEGTIADVTVRDAGRVIMAIRSGKIVADNEGLTIPDVSSAGPYSNFK